MARLRYNGLTATLDATGLTAAATSIGFTAALSSLAGAVPTLAAGDYIVFVVDGEIMHLTAYTTGALTGTIERAKEGTTAATHAAGATVSNDPTVADFGGGGSTPAVKARTSGSFALPAGGYTDVSSTLDLVVTASAGDWIEVGLSSGLNPNASQSVGLDMVTMVSGAPVNYISGAGSAGLGVQAWSSVGAGVKPIGGSVVYQLQAGDVAGGTVTLRLRSVTSSSGVTLFAQSDRPLHLWARRL